MATITKTVKPSGGDYTSLTSWNAGEQTNLPTDGNTHVCECYTFSGGLDDNVGISGWTTDATHYITVTVPSAERHDGTPNTGFYLNPTTSGYGGIIRVAEDYVRLEWISIDGNSQGENGIQTTYAGNTCDIRISYCLIHDAVSGSAGNGIRIGASQNTIKIWNSIILRCYRGVYAASENSNAYCYNVTAIDNGDFGLLRCVFKNCLSDGHTSGDFLQGQTGSNYNASGDSSAPGANSRTTQTFTFVSYAGDDLHLSSSDAGALDFGTDLSADSNIAFSDDIDGNTRTGSWDIGADEYVTVGTTVSGTLGTLTLTPLAASVKTDTSVSANVGSLALTANTATVVAETETRVDASAGSLTLTGYQATVLAENETRVTASLGSLSLTPLAATVTAENETRVTASSNSLTLTPNVATVKTDTIVYPTAGSLTLTANDATVTVGNNTIVNSTVGSLTLTPYQAAVIAEQETRITATSGSLTLTPYQAGVIAEQETRVNTSLGTLTLSPLTATVTQASGTYVKTTSGSLALICNTATVTYTELNSVVIDGRNNRLLDSDFGTVTVYMGNDNNYHLT